MDKKRATYIITDTIKQRNILLVACLTLLFIIVMQTTLLFSQERQIILLPTIQDEITVSNKYISPSYLHLIAKDIYSNVLNFTPALQEADLHRVLQYVSPVSYGRLHELLTTRFKEYSNRHISTYFTVVREEAIDNLAVEVEGYLTTYIANSQVINERKKYLLNFEYTGSRLLLTDFVELGE